MPRPPPRSPGPPPARTDSSDGAWSGCVPCQSRRLRRNNQRAATTSATRRPLRGPTSTTPGSEHRRLRGGGHRRHRAGGAGRRARAPPRRPAGGDPVAHRAEPPAPRADPDEGRRGGHRLARAADADHLHPGLRRAAPGRRPNDLTDEQMRMLRTIDRNSEQLQRVAEDLLADPGGGHGLRVDFTELDLTRAGRRRGGRHADVGRGEPVSCSAGPGARGADLR